MLPDALTDKMIDELETLLSELKAGQQPSNLMLEEAVRKRVRGDMLRESIDAFLPAAH